jgi:transketolase
VISKDDYKGNYLHYGIREHAMIAVMNGLSICGLRPYAGSFLVFSDYCRPAIRLAALMEQPLNMIFTHDSIGVGEDGPTHQPVEHLSALRAIPNLNVFRPADAIETCECWQLILQSNNTPSVLCLTRQGVQHLRTEYSDNNAASLGAYIIHQEGDKKMVTIFASGSEVEIAVDIAKILAEKDIGIAVVSVPCQELFWQQSLDYQMSLLCNSSLKVAIEAGVEQSWSKIIGPHGVFFGVKEFGKSAPAKDLYEYFEITKEKISKKILSLVQPTKI